MHSQISTGLNRPISQREGIRCRRGKINRSRIYKTRSTFGNLQNGSIFSSGRNSSFSYKRTTGSSNLHARYLNGNQSSRIDDFRGRRCNKTLIRANNQLDLRRNSGGNLIILTLNADLCRPLSIIRESASIGRANSHSLRTQEPRIALSASLLRKRLRRPFSNSSSYS